MLMKSSMARGSSMLRESSIARASSMGNSMLRQRVSGQGE